jgi:SAM-dependent methyltransferase
MIIHEQNEIIKVKYRNATLLYITGLIILVINKIRKLVKPYAKPRPFSMNDLNRNIEYVLDVVDQWEYMAKLQTGQQNPFFNAAILEIGPGPDLGTGIILLSRGAKSYHAIDMFRLAAETPDKFYLQLFDKIKEFPYVSKARQSFQQFSNGSLAEDFVYQQVNFPYLENLPTGKFDFVISQAVWEHISNPEIVLGNLIKAARKGAIFLNRVDLSTHSSYFKDIDPLNLLRYSDKIYDLLAFPGTPNRYRCSDYLHISRSLGFKNNYFISVRGLDINYVNKIRPSFTTRFRKKELDDLMVLSGWWLASFPELDP